LGVSDTGQLAEQDGCGGGKGGAAPETWEHLFFLQSEFVRALCGVAHRGLWPRWWHDKR
jgi:hypothetical protein